ncbi:MAG: TlpA family protein disulfide reductase [Isosphaeraceae bacterium]
MHARQLLTFTVMFVAHLGLAHAQEPAASSVAEILDHHDRLLIRDLAAYLQKNPKADDRDQAYASLFNKAIEHDWFADNEQTALRYLQIDPDGPVKALARMIVTMARAQAGRHDQALLQYKELMKGLGKVDQEEFATSFSDTFAASAVAAGEFATAREVYRALDERFADVPTVREKVTRELNRLDKVGKPAPVFDARDLAGQSVRLESLKGKYVLVDFWATWCSPCLAELPRLQEAYRKYKGAGFEIVSVSLDETRSAVADFVKVRKLPWFQLHNATAGADLVEAFGVSSIPATYLVDPEGKIIRLDLRGPALDATLAKVLKASAK